MRRALRESCYEATWLCPALDEDDAVGFVDRLVDVAISALRKHPHTPQLSFYDWQLVLGDWRRQAERELTNIIEGKIDRDDVIDEIVRELMGDDEDEAE
jgi:hypothetical protein